MNYEVKVKVLRTIEGIQKNVGESYIVNGESVADVETKIVEELSSTTEGEIEVDKIEKKKFSEVVLNDKEKYYTVRVGIITLDENSCTEKTRIVTTLIQADDFNDAYNIFKDTMSNSVMDYVIVGINEAPYVDYFKC